MGKCCTAEWPYCLFPIHCLNIDKLVTFQVMIAIITTWIFCAILTAAGALDHNSSARTDAKSSVLADSPWFRVPYPGNDCAYSLLVRTHIFMHTVRNV